MKKLLLFTCISLFSFSHVYGKSSGLEEVRSLGKAFNSVAQKSSPKVVFIETESRQRVDRDLHQYDPFGFRQAPREKRGGQGSGFVISSDGHIVTNNHVVADARRVYVTFVSGKKVVAKIIGTDKHTDIALLKIDLEELPYMKLADSGKVSVGEWVLALGNPFGLSNSLTAGIISATGRSSVGIANYENFIQTDAAINPGNSGGPLINLEGEAIGMNTAIFSRSGGYMGIGFSIPANMIKNIITQLKDKGEVTRGYLGISIKEREGGGGIYIKSVAYGAAASNAGIRMGDVINKIDNEKIKNLNSFRNLIAEKTPGDKVRLEIQREGVASNITVKVGKLPAQVSAR